MWTSMAALVRVGVPAILVVALSGCATPPSSASPGSAGRLAAPPETPGTALPTPTLAPIVLVEPTPIAVPSASAPLATSGVLVFTLHWTDDVVAVGTATVVRDDGLVVWNDGAGVQQLRVGPDGIAWMRDQLAATGLLEAPAEYWATLRPGAEPPGRGVTGYRFDVPRAGGTVTVLTGSAGDYDAASWIVPEEMTVLGDLAAQIRDADGWIPPELVVEAPSPFVPDEYLLHVTLRRGPEGPRSQDTDIADVAWPFADGLEGVGTVVPDEEKGQTKRCAVISRATAEAMVAAEQAAGVEYPHSLTALSQSPTLRWVAGKQGTATITLQQLLPDQHSCGAFAG
jgi:hypothetical protein